MPGNIFTRMFGCFGNENHVQANTYQPLQHYAPPANARPAVRPPAPPPAPAPALQAYAPARASFVPGRYYTASELQEIARVNPPGGENRIQFLNTLAAVFNRPITTRQEKAGLFKQIARLLGEDEALTFKGIQRQANYFASYSIDLNLQELDVAYNTNIERDVREMLTLWTNRLCPAQTEFNVDGVIYSRAEINDMLRSPTLIHRNTNLSLVPRLEHALRRSGSQNVHDAAVRNNGARVMDIMRQKHGQTTEMNRAEILRFVLPPSLRDDRGVSIRAGLSHCMSDIGFDPNSPGGMTPKQLLGNVCQYIQSITDTEMRSNLTGALLDRLHEIHVEHPCVTGVSQRLLDVPSGIDPDMNFAGRAAQVEEEVTTIAGKTYNQFTELVDEGIQAIQEIEQNQTIEANEAVVTDIGQNMFSSRLRNELTRLGGIAESEIAPHRERLKTGFASPS